MTETSAHKNFDSEQTSIENQLFQCVILLKQDKQSENNTFENEYFLHLIKIVLDGDYCLELDEESDLPLDLNSEVSLSSNENMEEDDQDETVSRNSTQ